MLVSGGGQLQSILEMQNDQPTGTATINEMLVILR